MRARGRSPLPGLLLRAAASLCRPASGGAAALLLAAACSSARLVPAGEANVEGDARRVHAAAPGVAVTVTARRWSAPPHRVLVRHTPIWIEVENTGDRALRLRPESFRLLGATPEPLAATPPDRVIQAIGGSLPETAVVRAQGLRPATLPPGRAVRGYLFFRRRFAGERAGEAIALEARFLDRDGARAVAELEIPLELGP